MKENVLLRVHRAYGPLITFTFSTLWHGVAPGYFVTAGSTLLFLKATNELRTHVAPRAARLPAPLRWAFGACGRLLNHGAVAFSLLPMMNVSGAETLAMLRALRFAPFAIALALLALCRVCAASDRHARAAVPKAKAL